MEIPKYLERIKYDSDLKTTKENLFKLQRHHLLYVPFENLDIHYGRKISLNLLEFFEKIVIKNRGGFCYELNGLFNELLKTIGFNSQLISGRVYVESNVYGQEFDHMAIIVVIENKSYLVDVGFGKFVLEPLEFIIGVPQVDDCGTFIIDKFDKDYYVISAVENHKRTPEYIFKIKERQLNEFAAMCYFHQSSNDSHFTKKKVISLARPNGRITLNNKTFKITENSKTETFEFEETEFETYLEKYFGIKIEQTSN